MKMELKNLIEAKVHNKFEAVLYSKDGKIKQEAFAENIVLNEFWKRLAQLYQYIGTTPYGIQIGKGTGTLTANRTSLFSGIGNFIVSTFEENLGYPISTFVLKSTFPANSTYVGEISEVGVHMAYSRTYAGATFLATHALFKDSEGNPIIINKTDTDILVVTATIYSETIISDDIEKVPPQEFWINSKLLGVTSNPLKSQDKPSIFLKTDSGQNIAGLGIYSSDKSVASVSQGPRKLDYSAVFRTNENTGNYGYADYIDIPTVGKIRLPNADYIPPYRLEPKSLGRGNGVKVTYEFPVPNFMEDTEIVKVGGTELLKENDYILDMENNTITFDTPPGDDKLITMSVMVDRPWKDKDYVFDCSSALYF